MFGLEGIGVPLGIVLTFFSVFLCVVYGLLNWNKGHVTSEELSLESDWEKEEARVEENLI